MSEDLTAGQKVRIVTEGVIEEAVNEHHGLFYRVVLPRRDFTEPRVVLVDPDELEALLEDLG